MRVEMHVLGAMTVILVLFQVSLIAFESYHVLIIIIR